MVTDKGIAMDEGKVKAILDWPVPRSVAEIRSFHGLATFYKRFIKGFSTIAAPLIDCLKLSTFAWDEAKQQSFGSLKAALTAATVLQAPDLEKIFELDCYASRVGIGGVLSQEGKPVAYFSEKLNSAKLNYSAYDVEFYGIVQAIKHWEYYLAYKEFILHTNHEALKHLNSQATLNKRHAKWAIYLQQFNFSLRHKAGVLNRVVDGLSKRSSLLMLMHNTVEGFEAFREQYKEDSKLFQIM